jgi:hypothetical protein
MPDDIGRLEQRDLRLPGASSAFGHASYTWSGGVSLTRSLSLNGAGRVDRAVVLDGYRRLDTLTHTVTGPLPAVDARTFVWSPAGELLECGYTKQGAGVGDM